MSAYSFVKRLTAPLRPRFPRLNMSSIDFGIQFQTPKATIPDFVRAKYPSEITIVLQHQFQDLVLTANAIEVVLTLLQMPEKVRVCYLFV